MTANTSPIYTLIPINTWAKVTAADTTADGTDADVQLIYTADATDGGYVKKVVCHPQSASGSPTMSACSLRIYLNNGSAVGTAGNNLLIAEISIPAGITVGVSASTAPVGMYIIPIEFQIQAGYRLYGSATAVAANTQWNMLAVAGDYS